MVFGCSSMNGLRQYYFLVYHLLAVSFIERQIVLGCLDIFFFFLKGIYIHHLRISHVLIVYFDHICPHHASSQLLPDLPSNHPNIIHPFFKICVFSLEFRYSIVFTLFQVLPLPPPIPPMLPFPSAMQLLYVPLRKPCR